MLSSFLYVWCEYLKKYHVSLNKVLETWFMMTASFLEKRISFQISPEQTLIKCIQLMMTF